MSIANGGKSGATLRTWLALAGILCLGIIAALWLASSTTGYAGAPPHAAIAPSGTHPAVPRPALDQSTSPREGRLLRFPDIYKDRIVFTYGGDLWLVPSTGGVARRITSNPGLELFPKFSPDGQHIAFTGQYDGNFNAYVMPSEGGQPRQLTYVPDSVHVGERMGPNNEVINWMPDGKSVLFLSRRDTFNSWFGRPFTVPIDGGLPVRFPLDKGGLISFAPDGHQIAYNRIFRNFRTWKRYTGGMAQKISIFDLNSHHYEQLTGYDGTDTFPMWHGDTIYFDSDRGPEKRLNLYSYNVGTKDIKQLTHFKDFDVNWPSLGPDSIVFENGGYLYVLDLATQQTRNSPFTFPATKTRLSRIGFPLTRRFSPSTFRPKASALFSPRVEMFSPFQPKTAAFAISPRLPASAKKTPFGRRTESGSPIFPIAPGKTSFTSLPRMVPAPRNASPPMVPYSGCSLSGRPTAKNSFLPTKTCACFSLTSTTRNRF